MCLCYIGLLLTREIAKFPVGIYTVRELTNDEKCQWKKIIHCFVVIQHCVGH